MVYRFILISDEINNFRRDITIDADATFFQLHELILNSVGYAKDQLTSFFICNDDWYREKEITLIDMDLSSDKDIYIMDSCQLRELLDEEGQKLIYIFDLLNDRCFFMELREIIPGKNQDNPEIVKFVGNPPKQIIQMENMEHSALSLGGNDYYDDELEADGYDEEDLENLNEEDIDC